jgi:hypothetical protein
MLIKSSRQWSSGPGYAYTHGSRLMLALCDTPQNLRLCVTPSGVVVKAKPYAPNPARTAYFIKPAGKKDRNL